MTSAGATAKKKRFSIEFWSCLVLAILAALIFVNGLFGGDRGDLVVGGLGALFFGFGAVVLGRSERGRPPPIPKKLKQSHRAQGPTRSANATGSAKIEPLNEEDRQALERSIEMLAGVGMFAPQVPTASQLEAAAADNGPPVGLDLALSSLYDTPHYDESFSLDQYTDNLRFHPSKLEQTSETIGRQVGDLVELSNGTLVVRDLAIEFAADAGQLVTVTCALNGEPFEASYIGSHIWLSTVVFQQIALRYERLGLPTRFAAFSVESGMYLTLLERGSVEELSDELPESDPHWELVWADEERFAYEAGDI